MDKIFSEYDNTNSDVENIDFVYVKSKRNKNAYEKKMIDYKLYEYSLKMRLLYSTRSLIIPLILFVLSYTYLTPVWFSYTFIFLGIALFCVSLQRKTFTPPNLENV